MHAGLWVWDCSFILSVDTCERRCPRGECWEIDKRCKISGVGSCLRRNRRREGWALLLIRAWISPPSPPIPGTALAGPGTHFAHRGVWRIERNRTQYALDSRPRQWKNGSRARAVRAPGMGGKSGALKNGARAASFRDEGMTVQWVRQNPLSLCSHSAGAKVEHAFEGAGKSGLGLISDQ